MATGYKTGGRQAGTPNKTTALLKDAILKAAEKAGGEAGLVGYLEQQASASPAAFMALLGKVLPMQVAGDEDNPVQHLVKIERVVVRPPDRDA
ncbi:hypothetical protein JRF84_14045 [Methylobacterium organophilum]|jgi:hypothetical protein|uniref:hypothetical protein n=1 Tax=Methylobacterium organophilum TaxID=410 RepID=UPI0019D08D85|nr:hypothetical protein [Methylobacterium organophilum]MBN6820700.1 hypothetical protein [Methylobacterium organophilum]